MKRNIYIIGDESGRIKLGIGKQPHKRVKQLQTGNPEKLSIIYQREVEFATKVETALHQLYSKYRGNGEWFDIPNFSYSEFDSKVSLYEKNFVSMKEAGNPFL